MLSKKICAQMDRICPCDWLYMDAIVKGILGRVMDSRTPLMRREGLKCLCRWYSHTQQRWVGVAEVSEWTWKCKACNLKVNGTVLWAVPLSLLVTNYSSSLLLLYSE